MNTGIHYNWETVTWKTQIQTRREKELHMDRADALTQQDGHICLLQCPEQRSPGSLSQAVPPSRDIGIQESDLH